MPTLILPPRYTDDSIALWKVAIDLGWEVMRSQNWRIDPYISIKEPFVYGEPLFARRLAELLSIELTDPAPDWLTTLPTNYLKRTVSHTTFTELSIALK